MRLLLCLAMLLSVSLTAATKPLLNVPAYTQVEGCAPTAAGMIMGYWAEHGYPNLMSAQHKDILLTANVAFDIDVIASFMGTDSTGSTLIGNEGPGAVQYAASRGYNFTSYREVDWSKMWSDLTAEIDKGRPVLVNVDSDGDGITNHAVAVIGYRSHSYCFQTGLLESEKQYICAPFGPVTVGVPWGVFNIVEIHPQ